MGFLAILGLICFAIPGLAIVLAYLSKMKNMPWPNMWKRIGLISIISIILGGTLIGIAFAIN